MKRILLWGCIALTLAGCDKWDTRALLGRSRASTESRRGNGNPGGEDDPSPEGRSVWLAGVEFPQGYDWQRDTAYGNVAAHLVLFRDGRRVLSVPAGEKYHVSTDPDMHRIIGGHLYTDYSSGDATWIGCDGKELFRFAGRELMAGFRIRDGDIWTLGLDRTAGKGITLRKNGKTVFTDPQGRLPAMNGREGGLLEEDDGRLHFFYYQETRRNNGSLACTWYRVSDGQAENLVLPQGVTTVYDLSQVGGKTVAVTRMQTGGASLTVLHGSESRAYATGVADGVQNVRILPAGGNRFYVKGELLSGNRIRPVLWDPEGTPTFFQQDLKILEFFAEAGHLAYLTADGQGYPAKWASDGFGQSIEGRNHFISSHCGRLDNGSFLLALTPFDQTGQPFLLQDGQRQEIPLNGYLTYISITR
ncbi:MAG: hypothetical protein IJ578_07975 [Bacteroidales bacterium]|nr:hypothetical protein [Bacteroidales bacterium]